MSKCSKHNRYDCWESMCKQDNAGRIGLDSSGDLTVGIGNGLGIDIANGDLTIEVVPGFSIDTGI